MSIKFNCANPACRQRVEVEDALADQQILCPSCSASLRVPSSKDIKFNCTNPSCGQHLVVDVSEAGRFVKCPACGKPLQVPGTPPKPLGSTLQTRDVPKAPSHASKPRSALGRVLCSPAGRLLAGWSMGAVILALLTTGFNRWSQIGLPPRLDQLSDEIYHHGIGEFRDTPVQLHGNDLLFLKYVENDVEVCHLDLATSRTNLLATIRSISADMGFTWVGWSPSARWLAYCAKGGSHHQSLFLRDGATGQESKSLSIPVSRRVGSGIWLSDNSVVLESEDGHLFIANLEADHLLGANGAPGLIAVPVRVDPGGPVCAVLGHTIAYASQGSLWTLDLTDNRASRLTALNQTNVSDLSYCPYTRKFIFTVGDPSAEPDTGVYEYDSAHSAPKLLQHGAADGQWVQDGAGFACIETKSGRRTLNVHEEIGHLTADVVAAAQGSLKSFTVAEDGETLYALASDERGASFISRYDLRQHQFARVLQVQGGYTFCRVTPPVEAATTNRYGERIDYYYLAPPHLDPKKRYPVLMDMASSSRHDHGRDAEFLANSGIVYVSPNKLGIIKWGVTPKPEDVLAVYDALVKNSNVDPHRIYITGESVTTGMASEMINRNPGLWRGFIAMEPYMYPVTAALKPGGFSALICMGGEDQYNGLAGSYGRAEKFLARASAWGIAARIHYEPYTPHAFQPEQYKEAYETVAKFILTGY